MSYPYGGINAVSLGTGAGSTLQGSTSIAIGYFAGAISQPASSIVLNASGTVLSGNLSNALYVAPVRNATATNLMMYDTVNKEVVYSDIFNGSLTANSIVSLTSLSTSTLNTSTMATNVSNVSTSNVQFVNFSTATGSTVSAFNLTATNALLASTFVTSTLSVNVSNVSTSNVQFVNFSTGSGSTMQTNFGVVNSTLTVSTLVASTVTSQFNTFSTATGSTMQTNFGIVNSTLTVSTLNATSLNVPGFSLSAFSTLDGSTLTASTVIVSSVNANFGVFNSTLTVSTLNATSINVPGLSLTAFSTLTGSTLTASTVIVSSVNANFGVVNSTLTVSTLLTSTVTSQFNTFSTASGSTIQTNFGIVNSTLTVSTLITSTITSQFINYSTLVGSTMSTTTMFVSSLLFSSISSVSGTSILGNTGATGPAATTGTIGQISFTAGGSQSITASASLAIVTWLTSDSTQTSGNPGLSYNYGSNPEGTFTNTTTGTLPVNIEYTLNLSATSGGYSAIGLNGSTLIYGGTFNDTNGFSNSCIILVPAGGYFGIYYQDNATVTVLNTSRIICTVVNVGGVGPTGPTGPQGQAIQASYAADGTQTGVFSSGTYVAVKFPTITSSQTQGTIPFTYNSGTGLFTNTSGITQLVLVEYSLSLNTTGGGYSAIGLNGVANLFGGMYNDSNFVSNSCSVLVPNNQTIGLYYVDNAGSAVTVQSGTAITLTLINAGAQGPTGSGAGMWSTTSSTSPYNTVATYSAGYVGMGMGPSGPSFLQTIGVSSTGNTGGTGSSIPQYLLDVAGTIRSAANQFMDGSTMVSAESALDYSTFAQTWNLVPGVTLPSNQYWYSTAMSGSGQYLSIGGQTNVGIYYSSNYGQTWTPASGIVTTGFILSIAMSKSGQYQIASTSGGNGIYYSSTYGRTWVQSAGTTSFGSGALCISASGQYASITSSTTPYYSTNYGVSWTASSSAIASTSIACSASGQYQVTATTDSSIYYSNNYGLTWTITNISNVGASLQPNSAAMSASGQYVSIPTNGNGVWYSTNYGQTFSNTKIGVGSNYVSSIAMSSSGQYQLCAGTSYIIYSSTDYGVTWIRVFQDTTFNAWYGLTMSSNGQYCFGLRSRFEPFLSLTRASAMGTFIMNGNVGMGLGPTGSSFLQTNFGLIAATGGTGSNVPQYTLDVVGSERVNGARLFPDNSAQITATPTLDYNTFGLNWAATNASITSSWNHCAISATGQYQIAASNGVGIYYSTNYGQTWIQSNASTAITWFGVSISASGQYAIATGQTSGTAIYISNNFGQTWLPNSQTLNVSARSAISASGQYMLAGGGANSANSSLYTSNNYGQTWTVTGASYQWMSYAMSASGQYMLAGTSGNGVWYSSNYGQTWTASSGLSGVTGGQFWSITMSASGQYASLAIFGTGFYYSSNYGQTWVLCVALPAGATNSIQVAMSASGQYVIGGAGSTNTQLLYYSTNYGVTWTSVGASPQGNWYGVAISSNGQYLLATSTVSSTTINQSITRSPQMFITGTGLSASYSRYQFLIGNSTLPRNLIFGVDGQSGSIQSTVDLFATTPASAWLALNPLGGNVGIGRNDPSFQLHLSSDSAAKPSTNTWTISSDERLKDSIVLADNTRCIEIIKAVPLKYYKWKDNVYTTAQVKDRSKLGWIAQDVEKVFPKAVGTTRFVYNQVFQDVVNADGTTTQQLVSENVIEDCKDLNADQLYAVMYGAVQKLIGDNELQATQLASQATQLASQATQLASQATQLASQATQITSLQAQVDQLLARLTAAGIP